MTDRTACLVPGCNCGTRQDVGREWICGRHWRTIPSAVKRPLFDTRRQYRKRHGDVPYWQMPAGSLKRMDAIRLHDEWWAAWSRVKTHAIERALGIDG